MILPLLIFPDMVYMYITELKGGNNVHIHIYRYRWIDREIEIERERERGLSPTLFIIKLLINYIPDL